MQFGHQNTFRCRANISSMDFFRAILETKEASSSESSDLSDGLSSTDVSFKEQRRVFIYGPSSSGRTSILFEVGFLSMHFNNKYINSRT